MADQWAGEWLEIWWIGGWFGGWEVGGWKCEVVNRSHLRCLLHFNLRSDWLRSRGSFSAQVLTSWQFLLHFLMRGPHLFIWLRKTRFIPGLYSSLTLHPCRDWASLKSVLCPAPLWGSSLLGHLCCEMDHTSPRGCPAWMLKTVISRCSLEMFQSCQFWCSQDYIFKHHHTSSVTDLITVMN